MTEGFYLSFATTEEFLGAIVVPHGDFLIAVTVTHAMKINPGGEVVGLPIPEFGMAIIPEKYWNRLLTREDLIAMDAEIIAIGEKGTLH